MDFFVRRIQWPVGQRCFASASITDPNGGSLRYIYDCGARSSTNVEAAVSEYSSDSRSCDALFISHLDHDHVSGLDRLLEAVDVESVYLPYLSLGQIALSIAHEDAIGASRLTVVQAMSDPVSWFGARGVNRIVLVGGQGEMPELPDASLPPEDISRDDRTAFDLKPQRPLLSLGSAGGGGAYYLEPGIGLLVTYGSTSLGWVLLPYVPSVAEPKRQAAFERRFAKVVRKFLGLSSDAAISKDEALEVLASKQGRKLLRKPYDEVFHKGSTDNHNRVSMSLYSGPLADTRYADYRAHTIADVSGKFSAEQYTTWPCRIGSISAGDAPLSIKKVRSEWVGFFANYLGSVQSFLLPHHGSKDGFDRSLLASLAAEYWIASADEDTRGYRHPHRSVSAAVWAGGRTLVHVTSDFSSGFRELVSIQSTGEEA